MTIVLFVHGINNQNNSKENIEQTWSEAIKSSADRLGLSIPADVRFKAAFYGDVLFRETESWDENKDTATPMSVNSPAEDYADGEVAALYREFQREYDIKDEEVKKELEPEDDLRAQTQADGIHKRWLKAIARILERILPPANEDKIVRSFLTQAAAYLHKPGLKETIDDIVKEQIFDDLSPNEEVVIISHSLGTVVMYALLRRLRHKVKAKLLVTAGSPLGVETVKRRLGMPLACLPNVKKWYNIADNEDFVALQSKLDKVTFGCDKIENISDLDNGEEDAHSILMYLSHDRVVKNILAHL